MRVGMDYIIRKEHRSTVASSAHDGFSISKKMCTEARRFVVFFDRIKQRREIRESMDVVYRGLAGDPLGCACCDRTGFQPESAGEPPNLCEYRDDRQR